MPRSISVEEAISELNDLRITLYLDETRVKQHYDQIGGFSESSESLERSVEVTVGFPKWLLDIGATGSASHEFVNSREIATSPELMALILEAHLARSQQFISSSNFEVKIGTWIKIISGSHIILPDEFVSEQNSGLSLSQAQMIQKERVSQERILKFGKLDVLTVVWVSFEAPYAASIMSTDSVNWGNMSSYGNAASDNKYGIYGRCEKVIDNVIFISPFWLWTER